MKAPKVMIAAAGSGSGKTFITCTLLQALTDMGKRAAAFKCGPDYIDPMFHQKVLGIPSKNLDTFFTGKELTKALFLEDAAGKDIAVIEGVMGLFDGLGGIREEASSYHLAKVLQAPVILVVDAHGMGRSLLPLIAGFLIYDKEHLIRGVILNKITKTFYEAIKPEIERELPVKVLGYFPFQKELHIESRHLGLTLPYEVGELRGRIKKAAGLLKDSIDMEALLILAEGAEVPENAEKQEKEDELKSGDAPSEREERIKSTESIGIKRQVPVGIAMDEAFCFYYEDNLRLLQRAGARLVPFSPLHDKKLPEGIGGFLLGGGYPELYAQRLSENEEMKAAVLHAVKRGMPSIAECGGFLYLHERMETLDKKIYPMAGAVEGECRYHGKLVRFGYVELQEKTGFFIKGNETIRGHEFHYFDSTNNGDSCIAAKPVSGRNWECVHTSENCWWGFPHLYYYSNPEYVYHFIERAVKYADGEKRE